MAKGMCVCLGDFLNIYFLSENKKLDSIQKSSGNSS